MEAEPYLGGYLVLVNDAAATFAVCPNFFVTVAYAYGTAEYWPLQTFFIHRYYTVAKTTVFSSVLMLIVFAHVRFHIRSSLIPSKIAAKAMAVDAAVCPPVEPFSLALFFATSSAFCASTHCRLVLAIVTILSSITAVTKVFSIFFGPMGRVYPLTILVNIIVPNSQRHVVNSLHIPKPLPLYVPLFLLARLTATPIPPAGTETLHPDTPRSRSSYVQSPADQPTNPHVFAFLIRPTPPSPIYTHDGLTS
ncbi:hypothetical protein B0H11DRAFT_2240525 [Mycena galericulata]|nr:hypothetical protein B0H11DRAFT_2240525 [Mycena galericulata]